MASELTRPHVIYYNIGGLEGVPIENRLTRMENALTALEKDIQHKFNTERLTEKYKSEGKQLSHKVPELPTFTKYELDSLDVPIDSATGSAKTQLRRLRFVELRTSRLETFVNSLHNGIPETESKEDEETMASP